MKYKKVANMNKIALFAESLNVKFRCSQFGISIISNDGLAKFFDIDKIFLDDTEVKSFIKECADPSLQTKLLFFSING